MSEEQAKALMRRAGCAHLFPKDGGAWEGVMTEGGVRFEVRWSPVPFTVGDGFKMEAGWWVGDEHEGIEQTCKLLAQALMEAVERRQRRRTRLTAEMDMLRAMGGAVGYAETEVGNG